MKVKRKMQYIRERLQLKQAEVAALLGVAECSVSRWETGLSMPPYRRLHQLSTLYEVPIEELMSTEL